MFISSIVSRVVLDILSGCIPSYSMNFSEILQLSYLIKAVMYPHKSGHKHRKRRLSRSTKQVVNWRFFFPSSSILVLGIVLRYYILLVVHMRSRYYVLRVAPILTIKGEQL